MYKSKENNPWEDSICFRGGGKTTTFLINIINDDKKEFIIHIIDNLYTNFGL